MEEPGIAQTVSKIRKQTIKLNKDGLTTSDLKILKKRLNIAWGASDQGGKTTAWRRNHARERYISIQDTSVHLFLAVILAIGPTECGGKPFQNVHHHLLRLGNYHEFHVDLKPVDKKHLTHLATQAGLSENHRYKTFLQALFPQGSSVLTSTESTPRQIEFAYSEIPIPNIELLFQIMCDGVESSHLREAERKRGATVSQFVTALIPVGDKDCCFTVTVGREEMMESIRRLGLTRLNI